MATEASQKDALTQVQVGEADEFAALLKQSFKPRTERAASEVENAVSTLVDGSAERYVRYQDRRARYDRGDDRPARSETNRAGERNSFTRRNSRRSRARGVD